MTNTYTEYNQEDFNYYYPIDFKNRKKYYLLNKYRPSFSWSFGDPIHLEFYLDKLDNPYYSGWYDVLDITDASPVGFYAEFGEMFSDPFSSIPFMDILDSFENINLLIEFYNSRFEKIFSIKQADFYAEFGSMFSNPKSTIPFINILDSFEITDLVIGNLLSININSELSQKLFYKGVFYCSIRQLDNKGNIIKTLLNSNDCSLYVS